MEAAAGQQWFLRKAADAVVFGPVPLEQLARWASDAQVAPNDSISNDASNWIKAPMLPELQMDWIVEVTSERYYGPTTLGALNEFVRLGEIGDDTLVINACDSSAQPLREIAPLLDTEARAASLSVAEPSSTVPSASGMAIAAQERIRELEQALREERRAFADVEERYRALEQQYAELLATRRE